MATRADRRNGRQRAEEGVSSQGHQEVPCYRCGEWFRVGENALTAMCPHCYRGVDIGDVIVKKRQKIGAIKTCGSLFVLPKGRLVANELTVGAGARIEGRFTGVLVSRGLVEVMPGAVVQGEIHASRLVVHRGGVMDGCRVETKGART